MDIKHRIFELFIKSKRLRFSEIEKALGIKSNTLAYHLESMVKDGELKKDEDDYVLTAHSESKIPFFTHITGKERGVMPVVLGTIVDKNKILMLKRNKRPYQGYWGLVGGKLKLEESIEECALREAKEETGLECTFSHVAAVIHERVHENGVYKHAFILFLVVLNPKGGKLTEGEEGKIEWFDLKNLPPDRIIPSDYYLLKEHLNAVSKIHQVVMEEKEERLIKFENN
ncbi:MAG TPA: NUDIX hydrolase [Candidatus Nanoarchaeia archaeon]|nr:NUDIX hydrolase [Candidatus Nanoarchaeia archaeon]